MYTTRPLEGVLANTCQKLIHRENIDALTVITSFRKAKIIKIICGNKMPTRCNRGFYCRSYCLLNMFRAPLTLSSTPDQQLKNHSTKCHRQQPLYNTLELLMMAIVVPETCWASNKICNKNLCCIWLAFYFHIVALKVQRRYHFELKHLNVCCS